MMQEVVKEGEDDGTGKEGRMEERTNGAKRETGEGRKIVQSGD